jgi:hypothetical protein
MRDGGATDRGLGEDASLDGGGLDTGELDAGDDTDAGDVDSGAPPGRRVFITSDFFFGNLVAAAPGAADGLAAGDRLCNEVAARASLGGSWRAWLSSDTIDAID